MSIVKTYLARTDPSVDLFEEQFRADTTHLLKPSERVSQDGAEYIEQPNKFSQLVSLGKKLDPRYRWLAISGSGHFNHLVWGLVTGNQLVTRDIQLSDITYIHIDAHMDFGYHEPSYSRRMVFNGGSFVPYLLAGVVPYGYCEIHREHGSSEDSVINTHNPRIKQAMFLGARVLNYNRGVMASKRSSVNTGDGWRSIHAFRLFADATAATDSVYPYYDGRYFGHLFDDKERTLEEYRSHPDVLEVLPDTELRIRWRTFQAHWRPELIDTPNVIIGIDLDVIKKATGSGGVFTDYRREQINEGKVFVDPYSNEGGLTKKEVIAAVDNIGKHRNIVGGHICGLSENLYQQPPDVIKGSLETTNEIFEALYNAMNR